ncbi:hypothetical protein LPJ61_003262 [Coemansia biformis]|uniref:Uncharacterized protein n=1 Tax=Coemansia biformis TaxID=1286918 RepID=A0A9W8CWF4_9FUNG|nr:hypothetical protein LPJ61_003262 [Coemansia biformis]
MDNALWQETAGTVLATLEPALLGGTLGAVAGATASAALSSSRKHARRTNSDTVSDIEIPGTPVKRRRESVGSLSAETEAARPSTKCRRITAALSNQFARSLSVRGGGSGGDSGFAACGGGEIDVDAIDMDSPYSSVYASSSSSPSMTSIRPWSSTVGLADRALQGGMGHGAPMEVVATGGPPVDVPAGVFGRRAMKLPVANRSARAHEKTQLGSKRAPENGLFVVQSQSSMDTDLAESQMHHAGDSDGQAGGGADSVDSADGAFALLLQPVLLGAGIGDVHAATHEWALGQAQETGQAPSELIEALNQHIARLKDLVPALLEGMGGAGQIQPLSGDYLREFCRAAIEAAGIGEWLCQRQFHLLAAVFPSLGRSLPQLSGAIRVARISEDMHQLVQWSPGELDMGLGEMGSAYEELVYTKRSLYGDMLAQDGLMWRAMGVPVDGALLMRVRQCLAAITEQCLTRVARTYERRARSASAYSKEDVSAENLLHASHQVLHAAALCAALCGDCFADLAPCVMFIVSECASWAANRLLARSATQSGSGVPSAKGKPSPALLRGKQLESRALRQAQTCESLLKLLAYARAILAPHGTSLDAALKGRCGDPTTAAACRSLATSLVDLSWSLAETLTAFHADGKAANATGAYLLFVDLVVKFGRRVADLGGPKVAQDPAVRPRLRQMQGFARGFGSLRDAI